jgi:hypothetical protein
MAATFENLGISFQYPENWQLDEDEIRAGQSAVTVYSPGGAFWSVALHTASTAGPAKMAEAALDTMRKEYDDLDAEPVRETIAGHDLVGFDLNFFCLDLTNTACIRALRADHTTYTIFFQAEDREYSDISTVFAAMTLTLLQSIRKETTREV